MILVDSNVLIDVVSDDPTWGEWSQARLNHAADQSGVGVNAIIFAEIARQFASTDLIENFVNESGLAWLEFTSECLFQAGQAHRRYRQAGGARDRVLPDFLIGAQADVQGYRLLTRDPRRYRTYFPNVGLITP